MKKIITLLALMVMATLTINAQATENKNHVYYQFAMVSFETGWGKKYMIQIQKGGSIDRPDYMTDENGYTLQFLSWIDAMNYLNLTGWEIEAHNSNTNMMEQWLVKKRVTKEQLETLVKDNTTVKQK